MIKNKIFNKRNIFLKVRKHLLTQNKKSERESNGIPMCLYRHNGLSCAIGCLIPDENYDPTIEEFGVDVAIVQKCLPFKKEITEEQELFLIDLQEIHDWFPPSKWDRELNKFTRRHKISIPTKDIYD